MERIKSFRGCPIRGAMLALRAAIGPVAALALMSMLFAGGCDVAHSEQVPDQARATPQSQALPDQVAHAGSGPRDDDPAYRDVPAPLAIADHAQQHPASDPHAPCTCALNVYHSGWCKQCNAGYVAGRRIEWPRLFEALDPHGHTLNPETFNMPLCTEAVQSDAWCPAISMGFVGGKLYFTRMTWGLAKGTPVNVQKLSCPACRDSGGDQPRWCENCARGIVGNLAYTNREVFDRTALELATLRAAITKAPSCEYCAAAMVAYQICPICRISYRVADASQVGASVPAQ